MLVAGRAAAGHRLVGPGRRAGCRSTWSATHGSRVSADERSEPRPAETGAAAERRPRPPPRRRADRRRARCAGPGASSPRCAPRWSCCSCWRSAAIPGSVIPQQRRRRRSRPRSWQDAAPARSTPIYEKLGLFAVYDSAWFAAIYLLLMVSLVGCIVPRLFVYWRGYARAAAAAPAQPDPAAGPRVVHHRRGARRRPRAGPRGAAAASALPASTASTGDGCGRRRARLPARGRQPALPPRRCWSCWSASAIGSLFGYKGGVILVDRQTASPTP